MECNGFQKLFILLNPNAVRLTSDNDFCINKLIPLIIHCIEDEDDYDDGSDSNHGNESSHEKQQELNVEENNILESLILQEKVRYKNVSICYIIHGICKEINNTMYKIKIFKVKIIN